MDKKKKINLDIELKIEYSRDKKEKIIYTDKEPNYRQNDGLALIQILGHVDSRKLTAEGLKSLLNVRDKAEEAFKKDSKKMELSLNQASALKDFLKAFFDKEKKEGEKIQLNIFLSRTAIDTLEQLEG